MASTENGTKLSLNVHHIGARGALRAHYPALSKSVGILYTFQHTRNYGLGVWEQTINWSFVGSYWKIGPEKCRNSLHLWRLGPGAGNHNQLKLRVNIILARKLHG